MPKKYKTTVDIDNDMASKLKELAAKDDRPLTSYIRKVLIDHINEAYTETNILINEKPKDIKPNLNKQDEDMNFATSVPKIKNDLFK